MVVLRWRVMSVSLRLRPPGWLFYSALPRLPKVDHRSKNYDYRRWPESNRNLVRRALHIVTAVSLSLAMTSSTTPPSVQ